MAKKLNKQSQSELPTRQRVLQYAAELRERAERERDLNVRQRMYAPSKDAASKEYQRQKQLHGEALAGVKALEVLARRAFEADEQIDAERRASRDARRRLVVSRSVSNGERAAVRARMSLGERLDEALLAIGLASEARTVQLDADRVSGGKGGGLPRTGDRHGDAELVAVGVVEDLERRAERVRRQLVEEPSVEMAA